MLQHVAACCSMLQHVAACCRMLQHVAACCSVLQCVAVCCSTSDDRLLVCRFRYLHISTLLEFMCDVNLCVTYISVYVFIYKFRQIQI